jgi:hypothetical protein
VDLVEWIVGESAPFDEIDIVRPPYTGSKSVVTIGSSFTRFPKTGTAYPRQLRT